MKKIDWKERERILSGEELTEEEKQQFGMDYDEWKAMHDESRQELVESYRWGSWPMLFIAGFFLITSGIRNTKILMEPGMGAGAGIIALAVASWALGAVSIVVAIFMRKKSKELQCRKMERELKEKEMHEAEKMSGIHEKITFPLCVGFVMISTRFAGGVPAENKKRSEEI